MEDSLPYVQTIFKSFLNQGAIGEKAGIERGSVGQRAPLLNSTIGRDVSASTGALHRYVRLSWTKLFYLDTHNLHVQQVEIGKLRANYGRHTRCVQD